MKNYIIFTDSACDIPREKLNEWGGSCCCLTFSFVGSDKNYEDYQLPQKEFYDKMRAGAVAKTSAINVATFKNAFRKEAEKGNDIIYIGFSSGLSTTFNSGRLAMEELREEFPERKLIAVDSLCASAGFGLLLYLAVQKKQEGATIEELEEFVINKRLHICHWFTVDDLVYLKRGGRISPTVALVGKVLGIKPILHMDNEGHLINMGKVHGRKNSIKALADKFGELAEDTTKGPIFVCQGDCMDDVKLLDDMLKEKYGLSIDMTVYTGAVIGSHSGPNTLSIFFVGKER